MTDGAYALYKRRCGGDGVQEVIAGQDFGGCKDVVERMGDAAVFSPLFQPNILTNHILQHITILGFRFVVFHILFPE